MEYNKEIEKLDIAELDISVRAYNTLRRKGINTIGDFFEAIKDRTDMMGQIIKPSSKVIEEVFSKIKEYEKTIDYKTDGEKKMSVPGKEKCKKLKQIRKLIAEVNDIPFETVECYHEGPCTGTCPACDAEIKYLDEQLQQKIRRGEKVTLSGLAVDMVGSLSGGEGINEGKEDEDVAVDGRDTSEHYVTMGQDDEELLDDEDNDDPENLVMGKLII